MGWRILGLSAGDGGSGGPVNFIDREFATRAARLAFYTTDTNAVLNRATLERGETITLIDDDGTGYALNNPTNIAVAGTVATVTSAAHGTAVGRVVRFGGTVPAGFAGAFRIMSAPTADTFTINVASGTASPGAVTGATAVVDGQAVIEIWTGEDNPSTYADPDFKDITGTGLASAATIKALYESNANTEALETVKKEILDLLTRDNMGRVVSQVSWIFPPDTVFVSENLGIEGSGEAFGVFDQALNRRGYLVAYERTSGAKPFYRRLGTLQEDVGVQTSKAVENPNTSSSSDYTLTANRLLVGVTLEAHENATGARVRLRRNGQTIADVRGVDFVADTPKKIAIVQGVFVRNAADLTMVVDGVKLKGANSGEGNSFQPFLEIDNYEFTTKELVDVDDISNSFVNATILNDVVTLTRRDGTTVELTIGGDNAIAGKRYSAIEPRRANFTLEFSGVDGPGKYFRVEQAATVTLPASSSDDQLGDHWGIANISLGQTVTLTPDTPDGHTVIIEGYTRPFDMESGTSLDLVLVSRTSSSSVYRIMNMSNGVEGTMSTHTIIGNSINIFGISGRPVHYTVSTAGSANFDVNVMGVGLLPRGESCRALIENKDATYAANLKTTANVKGTNTRVIAIEPGNSRWITITNTTTGTLEVDIDGPVIYEFMLSSHDILNTGDNKGDWGGGTAALGVPSILSGIITSPTLLAERDRLVASTNAGFLLEFNFMADFAHGSSSSSVSALISVRGDINDSGGAGVQGPVSTRRVTGGTGGAQETAEINKTWFAPMASGHHFNLRLTGFPVSGSEGPRMINPFAKVRVIIKR